MTLKIWGRASSSNVQPVMWCIGELGLPHERIDVGGKFGGLETEEFRSLNPNGKIPVLQDGELIVWESRAILRYLAAEYGDETFWPEAPRNRAPIDQWLEWAKTTIDEALITGVFWGYWRTPKAERDMETVHRHWTDVNAAMAKADARLEERAFLCGDDLTLADIGFGYLLYRYFTLPLTRPDRPNLAAYYQRLTDRQPYREHIMIDYHELFGRLDF
ncbi:MAG: glutathione S-transferase family protein [Pseudomonadota bacterium]